MAARRKRRGLKVVLGISGSIAAYKACLIVRDLVSSGAEVRCVMTPNAEKFITPLTLSALSRAPVGCGMFDSSQWEMSHLSLSAWADLILIAPATADLIARLAQGRAGGLVEAVVLASRSPVYVAPAMETGMWKHAATRANVERLKSYGYKILGPVRGELASGGKGMGRMMEPDDIVRQVLR